MKRNSNKALLREKGFNNISSDEDDVQSTFIDDESKDESCSSVREKTGQDIDDSSEDDDDSLKEVLSHKEKKTRGGKTRLELEVLCSSGDIIWGTIKNIEQDKPGLIETYVKKNGLESNPHFQLKTKECNKKQKVSETFPAKEKVAVDRDRTKESTFICIDGKNCNFDLELQVQEYLHPMPYEWIYNKKCINCKKVFDSSCTIKTAFVCKATRRMDCSNIFCFECGSSILQTGRRKRKR